MVEITGDTLTFEGQEAVSNLIESIEIAARTVPSPGTSDTEVSK